MVMSVVVMATFLLSLLIKLLPGDPAEILVPNAIPETLAEIRKLTGLDKGTFGYYWHWLSGMFRGDFGNYYTGIAVSPISNTLKSCLPVTLLVILYVQVFSLLVSVPLGLISAYRENSRFDRIVQGTLFSLSSIPGFAMGLLLSLILAVRLGWLPPLGYTKPGDDFIEHLRLMIMPILSLSLGTIASYTRLLRADVLATLKEDYVTMAASKGISNQRVLWRHVLRPSSTTLLTSAALNMGALIGGTVIVEVIFQIPGIGYEIAYAIGARQIIAIQTYVALIAFAYVFFNSIVDILTNIIDPRTRERRV